MSEIIPNLFRSSEIAASGLRSNRSWMNIISNNIANINTVDTGKKTKDGNYVPYARQVPVFAKVLSENFRENRVNGDVVNGVEVKDIAQLKDNVKKVYDPSHPAARTSGPDAGYVFFPAVSLWQEISDMKLAAASYEANLTAMSISNKMNEQALQISRR